VSVPTLDVVGRRAARRWWATWLPAVGVLVASSGAAAATTSTTSPGASNRPAPVCVRAPARTVCSTWVARDTWAGGLLVATAQFTPVPSQPAVRAYAAWIKTVGTQLALYPGYEGPGPSPLPRGPQMVPVAARPRLLATFNSGFYEKDAAAGFYANHLLYHPMVAGLATVVRYVNGRVDVLSWHGGARPGPDVALARQNLNLLVAGGAPTPRTANNALWGVTLHGVPAVWRTALGVTAAGDLVYAAAPAQTAQSLARIMVQLHCVRALQLDINPEWPIFVTYAHAGAIGPSLFVPNPNQIPGRFLYSSTKDFFAVYKGSGPGQPW
jgi:hypothetical protein